VKTKGAICWGPGEPWAIEELDMGEPVAGEVRIRLASAGLCHSDEHMRAGDAPSPYPLLGGHEGAGVVEAVGPNVTSLEEGDHVVSTYIPACGRCVWCARGQSNICDLGGRIMGGIAIADGTYRTTVKGQGAAPMTLLGTFSPYITVHDSQAVKIRDDVPLVYASLLSCGVLTGFGSATKIADVGPGETVVVVGCGGVGANAVWGAAMAGAARVIVVDPSPVKESLSKQFGATHWFPSMAAAAEPIRELTWGVMADKVIVTVGELQPEMVQEALTLTSKGGIMVLACLGKVSIDKVAMKPFWLSMLQKQIRGTVFGGCNPRTDIPRILDLYKEGRYPLEQFVTKEYRLEEVNTGYADMLAGTIIRGLIRFDESDFC
jgi:S-(hydroxymethyl)glutathione dehydrogenase / alcohol dehydrogenase